MANCAERSAYRLRTELILLRHLDAERSFSALILDMDGLMIDTEAVEFRSWTRAAGDFGWSFSREQHAQLLGRTNRDCWALMTVWWDERPASRGTLTEVWSRAGEYSSAEPVAVKKGLFELLDWAKREQVPVAVASSSTRATVASRLREAGTDEAVDATVGGDDVEHGKPAPDIFLEAARRLGREPRACVVLEDSDSGISAAAAARMIPILVPDSSVPRVIPAAIQALAYRICGSLNDVLDVLSAAPASPGKELANPWLPGN
ncbi:MAG TPA: HAD family phosphatase [Streptosporangiaceae bacterium]|nr:HAD family phosphatase [Streptosporangiaceae bacterium]